MRLRIKFQLQRIKHLPSNILKVRVRGINTYLISFMLYFFSWYEIDD